MSSEALIKLHLEVPNIIYYKIECKPPGHYISRLLDMSDGGVGVFIGNAGFQMIEGLDRGACGVMPGPSMYDLYVKIYNFYRNGNRQEAIMLHKEIVYILNHIRQSVEMIISYEKRILESRGIIASDYCRHPSYHLDDHDIEMFKELFTMLKKHLLIVQKR